MEIKELKPCPFCGGRPELKRVGKSGLKIECTGCHISITQRVFRFSLGWLEDKMVENLNIKT